MKRALAILGLLGGVAAGPALADGACLVPMADWQPREALTRFANDHGWTVRRLKIDDGCYKLDVSDSGGNRFAVTVHPTTLRVIEVQRQEIETQARHEPELSDGD